MGEFFHFYFGRNGECGGPVHTCVGSVRTNEFGAAQSGFFLDGFGLSVVLDTLNEQYIALNYLGSDNHGVMLVRTPVPIPAAVWLFGSGLLGLIGFSKRKKVA